MILLISLLMIFTNIPAVIRVVEASERLERGQSMLRRAILVALVQSLPRRLLSVGLLRFFFGIIFNQDIVALYQIILWFGCSPSVSSVSLIRLALARIADARKHLVHGVDGAWVRVRNVLRLVTGGLIVGCDVEWVLRGHVLELCPTVNLLEFFRGRNSLILRADI